MDHWDKKVKEVQRIFSDLLSNKVLESISTFTSRKDMVGAWNELNKKYFHRLIPYADTIFAALRSYIIRPKQELSNYIWCLEIIYESCMDMMGRSINQNSLRDMLERGIKEDYRFKHICAMMLIANPKPNYEVFKERIQSIEIDKQIEDTILSTMEKSIERKYHNKSRVSNKAKATRNYEVPVNNSKSEEDVKNKLRDIECFKCKKKGHLMKDCKEDSDADSAKGYASTRSSTSNKKKKFDKNKKMNKRK
jgi:hypothetical protein